MQVTRHDSRRVTPFGHPGITARLTAPPGLSRPPTSFIGPWCQGIHRPPLPTYPNHTNHNTTHTTPTTTRCSRPLCTSQPTTNPPPATHQQPAAPGTKTTTPPRHTTHRARHPPGTPAAGGVVVPSGPNRVLPADHQPPPPRFPTRTTPRPHGRETPPGRTPRHH